MRKNLLALLSVLTAASAEGLATSSPGRVNNQLNGGGRMKRSCYRFTMAPHDHLNAEQKSLLYADTPKHPPTRQQRRAAGKAWRNSTARVARYGKTL